MPKRMLLRKEAAEYCSLSVAGFEREINAGRLPFPVELDEMSLDKCATFTQIARDKGE